MDEGAVGVQDEEEGLFEYVYTPPLRAVGGNHYCRQAATSDTAEYAIYPSHIHKHACRHNHTHKQRDYRKTFTYFYIINL